MLRMVKIYTVINQLCEIGFGIFYPKITNIFGQTHFQNIHSTNPFLGAEIFTCFIVHFCIFSKLNAAKALKFGKPLIAYMRAFKSVVDSGNTAINESFL